MLSVRPLSESDIPRIMQYWLEAEADFLKRMGVDLTKMPAQEAWELSLQEQLSQDIPEKKSYCIIWEIDGQPMGQMAQFRTVCTALGVEQVALP
jgi:hypothetical protein